MRKLVRQLLMLTIILPILLGMVGRVEAANGDTVSFTLHKIVFPENELPAPSQNDGDERLKAYDGLNGVTYDVYDVTEDFNTLMNQSPNKDARDIQTELQGMDLSNRPFIEQQVTATVNGEDGIANFKLPMKSNNRDAVYLFRESAAPSDVKSRAADMIVALPVLDDTGKTRETVHLYPKNEILQPSFEKMIIDQQPSYQLGDPVDYKLTTKLPSSLSMYSKYLISDQADESLLLDAKSLKVQIADQDFDGYQAETTDHGFKLTFDLAKLKAHAGKPVTIAYTMTVKDKDKVDQEIINQAELETDFDKIIRKRKIKTGGKKFIKIDAIEKNRTLADAVFLVKNAQGEYLQESEVGYRWNEDRKAVDLVKLTSNKEGFFEVKGLRYGNYSLEEIKAPNGYLLSKKEVSFEVSENSYTFSKGILQIVNQKDGSTKQPDKPVPTQTKKQAASGSAAPLPKMNDTQNRWFVLVGGILVLSALMFVVQRKTKRSE